MSPIVKSIRKIICMDQICQNILIIWLQRLFSLYKSTDGAGVINICSFEITETFEHHTKEKAITFVSHSENYFIKSCLL